MLYNNIGNFPHRKIFEKFQEFFLKMSFILRMNGTLLHEKKSRGVCAWPIVKRYKGEVRVYMRVSMKKREQGNQRNKGNKRERKREREQVSRVCSNTLGFPTLSVCASEFLVCLRVSKSFDAV